ncbi:hypothetical protein NSQ26_07265 [Bacillus sp. FSL W7-1360]
MEAWFYIILIVCVVIMCVVFVNAHKKNAINNEKLTKENMQALEDAKRFRVAQTEASEKSMVAQEAILNEIKALREEVKQLKNNE